MLESNFIWFKYFLFVLTRTNKLKVKGKVLQQFYVTQTLQAVSRVDLAQNLVVEKTLNS